MHFSRGQMRGEQKKGDRLGKTKAMSEVCPHGSLPAPEEIKRTTSWPKASTRLCGPAELTTERGHRPPLPAALTSHLELGWRGDGCTGLGWGGVGGLLQRACSGKARAGASNAQRGGSQLTKAQRLLTTSQRSPTSQRLNGASPTPQRLTAFTNDNASTPLTSGAQRSTASPTPQRLSPRSQRPNSGCATPTPRGGGSPAPTPQLAGRTRWEAAGWGGGGVGVGGRGRGGGGVGGGGGGWGGRGWGWGEGRGCAGTERVPSLPLLGDSPSLSEPFSPGPSRASGIVPCSGHLCLSPWQVLPAPAPPRAQQPGDSQDPSGPWEEGGPLGVQYGQWESECGLAPGPRRGLSPCVAWDGPVQVSVVY